MLQSVLAHWTSVVRTACFCTRWCSDLACRYNSIWVDFLYTECPSDLSSLLLIRTSKKGKLVLCSTSIVNLMFGWMLFRYCRKPCSSFLLCGHTLIHGWHVQSVATWQEWATWFSTTSE
jgi:hypothetical protein